MMLPGLIVGVIGAMVISVAKGSIGLLGLGSVLILIAAFFFFLGLADMAGRGKRKIRRKK